MLVAHYPNKKTLKASIGQPLRHTETSIFGEEYLVTGTLYVVGPSATERRWYAAVDMKDGKIFKVR